MTHQEIFSRIYKTNLWGGSGGGSTPSNTVEYRQLLQDFLWECDIKTVVDFGCGDWMFSHLIDWKGIEYLGIDCVESVIGVNKVRYSAPNIQFKLNMIPPPADLLILKDVLQHWDDESIIEFMETVITDFKYILITNSPGGYKNITTGETRGLSALEYPLNKYNPKILRVIKTTELKEVSLIS